MAKQQQLLVAIDTGTVALGVALFDDSPGQRERLGPPLWAEVFTARKADDWMPRLAWLHGQVEALVDRFVDLGWNPRRYALEWPEFRASAVGIAAAATSSLGQLAAACGWHSCAAVERYAEPVLVPVSKWKGSLPKKVVTARITGAIGLTDQDGTIIQSHAIDAVGVGLFAKGYPMSHQAFCGKAKP